MTASLNKGACMVKLPTRETIEELLAQDQDILSDSVGLRRDDASLQPGAGGAYGYGGQVRFTADAFPDADIDFWSKAAFWGWDEGILLSFGKAPEIAHGSESLQAYLRFAGREEEYHRLRTLVHRAIGQGDLPERIPPVQFISWARQLDIAFPPAFEAAVKKRSGAKPENKTAQAKKIDSLRKLVITQATMLKYDPKANYSRFASSVVSAAHRLGISIDEDTIREHLQEAKTILPDQDPSS